jgi:polyhydroxybutyrate depolymerase
MDGQITSLEGQYSIDPRRIYTTGISNGGGMTDRVGCTMADIIAAIAPDTGVQLTMVMIFCDDHHE